MSVPARLLAFGGLLAAIFAVALVAGGIADPESGTDKPGAAHAEAASMPHAEAEGESHGATGGPPPGLAVSDAGYTLDLATRSLARGRTGELRFRILGPDGRAVRDFEVEHTRRMHLILARTDLSGFQHLHPRMDADGTWSTPVRLPDAGGYRVFADFRAAGAKRTLAANLPVAGPFAARPLPAPAPLARTGGYAVRLTSGPLRAGRESELRFAVTRGGRSVTPEPYLGARGHLVALREGDLAFLHVHPDADRLAFGAEFPTAGRYRLFLQFRAGGTINTVAFTVEVTR